MEGKRKANLEPIRFYVFASTVFFILLYFSVGSLRDRATVEKQTVRPDYNSKLEQLQRAKEALKGTTDTIRMNAEIDSLRTLMMSTDTLVEEKGAGDVEFNLGLSDTSDLKDMGRFQQWMLKRLSKKEEELQLQYGDNDSQAFAGLLDEIFHAMPKLIFLSLPFFALLLKLFYWRSHRKVYVEHFIFSIYLYSFFFTLFSAWLVMQMGLNSTRLEWTEGLLSWLYTVLAIYPFIYLLLAMKRFYMDRWRFLIPRFLLLVLLFWILIVILFFIMAFVTVLF